MSSHVGCISSQEVSADVIFFFFFGGNCNCATALALLNLISDDTERFLSEVVLYLPHGNCSSGPAALQV